MRKTGGMQALHGCTRFPNALLDKAFHGWNQRPVEAVGSGPCEHVPGQPCGKLRVRVDCLSDPDQVGNDTSTGADLTPASPFIDRRDLWTARKRRNEAVGCGREMRRLRRERSGDRGAQESTA